MADKVIRGYWDCNQCGTKGIDGLVDVCPACGAGKGKDVRYYMKEAEAVSSEELEKAGISAEESDGSHREWICAYCGNLNNFSDDVCVHCGASKEEKEQDYGGSTSQIQYKRDKYGRLHRVAEPEPVKEQTYQTVEDVQAQEQTAKSGSRGGGGLFGKLLPLVAILAAVFLLWPHTSSEAISGFEWQRSVTVEELQTFSDSGWQLPTGARVRDTRVELYGYQQVLDHYETVYETRTRQVLDHYDTSYTYTDNGNGTFTEHEVKEPVYRTETYEEPVRQPVYRSEPVYQKKYYYEIDRWVEKRQYDTSGKDHEPYWSDDYTLGKNQRDVMRRESYVTIYNDSTKVRTDYDTWEKQEIGDGVYVTKNMLGIEYSRKSKGAEGE